MSRLPLIVLMVLLVGSLLPAPAATATIKPLPEVFRETTPHQQLEIRFANGAFTRGQAVSVRNDTLYLQRPEDPATLAAYPLNQIVGVLAWRSNSRRGASWGATSGAIVVGAFGLLVGAVAASFDNSDRSNLGPVIGIGLLGAGTGAGAGALLGLGMGSLSHSWQEIWPQDTTRQAQMAYAPPPPADSEATRLGLFAGWARPMLDGYEVTRLAGRVSLRKSLGQLISVGPEISFHDFEGAVFQYSPNGTSEYGKENLLKIALAVNVRSRRRGLSPYVTTGLGWFVSNDAYLGAHFGGGLRWQYKGGNDLEFDVRYHLNLTPVDPNEVDQFWTMGLSLGLDL